ncbi:MAG TPA: inorganic phosphate transporter [Exilispira sp.]|nr:inorganic phosphate transporter [Exilispira sp.]
MAVYLILIPFFLTIMICILNGANDGTYLLLPLFSNESFFNKYGKGKLFLILTFIGEIIGATFLGEIVLKKIQYGFIYLYNPGLLQIVIISSVILFVTLFIYLISSFLPFPVSLSHTMIGGLIGTGLFFKYNIIIKNLISTIVVWTITPLVALLIGLIVYKIVFTFSIKNFKSIRKIKNSVLLYLIAFNLLFLLIFFKKSRIGFIVILIFYSILTSFFLLKLFFDNNNSKLITSVLKKRLKEDKNIFLDKSLKKDAFLDRSLKEKEKGKDENILKDEYDNVEKIFTDLSLLILPDVFIAHGANDVANCSALFSLVLFSLFKNRIPINYNLYILFIFSIILSSSIIFLSTKKAKKLSCNIFTIESSKIFVSYYSLAISTILFSFLGYRVSSIYTLTGSYIGIGYAKGFSIFNSRLLFTLLVSWILTFGLSVLLTYSFYFFIKYIGIIL